MDLINQAITHKTFGKGVIINQTESTITILFGSESKRFLYPDSFREFISLSDKVVNAKVMSAIELLDNSKSNKNIPAEPQVPLPIVKHDMITYPLKASQLNLAKILNIKYKTSISSREIMTLFASEFDALILSHVFRIFTNQRIYDIDLIIARHSSHPGKGYCVYVSSLTFTRMKISLAGKTFGYDDLSSPSLCLYADFLSEIIEDISAKNDNTLEKMEYSGKSVCSFKNPLSLFAQINNFAYQYGETSHFSVVGVLYS